MAEPTRRQIVTALTATLFDAGRSRAAGSPHAAIAADTQAISESGFVPIGGIEQWIAIRGQRADNPAIVSLHGGFGDAQSPFLAKLFAPWESNFTVLTWDQRGSGKTYGKYGKATPGMATPESALETLTRDAIEVAQYARRKLHKERVVLVGHSCGSIVGLKVVKRRPDLFHAYVASGFPANWMLMIHAREAWVRKQATKAGDAATLKALDAATSLPIGDLRRFIVGQDYLMPPSDVEYLQMESKFIGAPATPNKGDAADWVAGFNFSQERVLPAVTSFDARVLGLDFKVAFFIIQGRDDHVTFFADTKAYAAELRAPRKGFVAIDGGHFACFTNPTEFVPALRHLVSLGAST